MQNNDDSFALDVLSYIGHITNTCIQVRSIKALD